MTNIESDLVIFLVLLLFSLLPALVYLAWIRKTERYHEEAWGPLLRSFAYGAFIGTFISLILELALTSAYSRLLQPDLGILPKSPTVTLLVAALVIAPFVEEGVKGLGVLGQQKALRFIADGLVFGAAVGFGFGFVENLLYGLSGFLVGGITTALVILAIRAISTVVMHGSATAMTGFGVALDRARGGKGHSMAAYYLLAVLMHSAFNLLVSLSIILPLVGVPVPYPDYFALVTLAVAIAYALGAFGHVRRRVAELQFQSISPRYAPQRLSYRPAQAPTRGPGTNPRTARVATAPSYSTTRPPR